MSIFVARAVGVRILRDMNTIHSIRVYESSGSDGYTEGTFGYHVVATDEEGEVNTYVDGGYESRELAREGADRKVASLVF